IAKAIVVIGGNVPIDFILDLPAPGKHRDAFTYLKRAIGIHRDITMKGDDPVRGRRRGRSLCRQKGGEAPRQGGEQDQGEMRKSFEHIGHNCSPKTKEASTHFMFVNPASLVE